MALMHPSLALFGACALLIVPGRGDADAQLRGREWAPATSWEAREPHQEGALLKELEASLGKEHREATELRVARIQERLQETFRAMPKNEYGNFGHSAVRYALHRYFVQQHGWFVHGLDPMGGAWNASSPTELLRDHVPPSVQGLFEKRLGGRGFGVHEMAVLAATLENLVHAESMQRLAGAYRVHRLSEDAVIEAVVADEVIDTYMASYIMNTDLLTMTPGEAIKQRKAILEVYPTWGDLQAFARGLRRNVGGSRSQLPKAVVAEVVTAIEDQYGRHQRTECLALKNQLLRLEESGTGCVRLADFYGDNMHGGSWQFSESRDYLQQLGALDESDAERPRVLVPNYIGGPSNCVSTSSFHQTCCPNECEDLVGSLERQLAAPDASPSQMSILVSALGSSTVQGGRQLPDALLQRLSEIAALHGGRVPLHSRLFAQWMHHAFPRECPFPHVSKTTKPLGLEDYMDTGREPVATKEEMLQTRRSSKGWKEEAAGFSGNGSCTPWHVQEELHFAPPSFARSAPHELADDAELWMTTRCVALFAALASAVLGLIRVRGAALRPERKQGSSLP